MEIVQHRPRPTVWDGIHDAPLIPDEAGNNRPKHGGRWWKTPAYSGEPSSRAHVHARISHLFLAFTLYRSAQWVDFNGKRGEGSVLFPASPRVKAMVSAGEGLFTKVFTLIALWHSALW